jgi:hypothetical protein
VTCKVRTHLLDEGFVVRREVPFLSKRIDIVGVQSESRQILAVEAKVRDWRKGLRQALTYRLCADEVYLALAAPYAKRADRGLLAEFGVGLMAVDGSARLELNAWPSQVVAPAFAQKVRSYVIGE